MKFTTLKLLAAALLSTGALLSTATEAQAARSWPAYYKNAYVNNTQQYILIRQDVAPGLGLTPGKRIVVDGQAKYFVRSDGRAQQGGPVYYMCLFSDVPPTPAQPARTASRPAQSTDGFIHTLRFKPKGSIGSPNQLKTVRCYNTQVHGISAQMAQAGYEFAYSTIERM